PRQRVMLAADALRAVTQALVAVLLVTDAAAVWHLVVLFALYGAADAFFSPAATGLVPEVVSTGGLQQANALLGLTRSVPAVLGPALAGVLVAPAGPAPVFALDAAPFAVSSISLACLRVPRRPFEPAAAGMLADLRAGWGAVAARAWVGTSI